MKWYVDYEDLSTCAVAVQNRHSTWRLPARRGENAVLPSRDGSLWNGDKPFDENEFALEMFAAGAEDDGTMPEDESRAVRVRKNLDRLTRIFGSDKLLTLAYVEDDAEPYGRRNVIPNPSFEAVDGVVVTRENVISNPSGEASTAKAVQRRNCAPNPGMDEASSDLAIRRNLVVNPRMDTDGTITVLRTNLCPNPSAEVSTQHWAPAGTAALARPATTFVGWPLSGRRSFRLTTGAAGVEQMAGGPCPVVAGQVYYLSAYGRNAHPSASRSLRASIQWRNRRGAVVGTASVGSAAATAAGDVSRVSVTATAPAGATAAYLRLAVTNAGAAGEVTYWDQVLFEQSSTLGDYFDGETIEIDGLRHDWTGEPGVSSSRRIAEAPAGWTSERTLMATSDNKMSGIQSAKVLCQTAAAAGVLLIGQQVRYAAALSSGVAAGLIHVRPGDSVARQVTVRLACYDAGRNYLGPLLAAPGGAALADVTADLEADSWTPIEYGGGTVQPGTDRVAIEVRAAGASWTANSVAYFDQAMVEPAKSLGSYFDGTVPDTEDFDFRWVADPHWSESELAGAAVDYWTATGGFQYQIANGYLGDTALRLEAVRNPTGPMEVVTDSVRHGAGTYAWAVYVRPRVTADIVPFVRIGGVETAGAPVSCPAGAWTRVSQTGLVVPEAATKVSPGIRWAAPADGDYVDVDAALLEASGSVRPFFDGDSGTDYAWDGLSSVHHLDRADGWSPTGSALPTIYRSSDHPVTGTYSVAVVARRAGDVGATSGRDSVVAGRAHAFGIDVRPSVAGTVRVGLRWLDGAGDEVGNDFADAAAAAGSYVRHTITDTPPAGAMVVSPYVVLLGASTGDTMHLDRAFFGFGGDPAYADGSTATWKWKGIPHASVSVLEQPRADNWSTFNATLARSSAWSSDRDHSGLVVATGPGAYIQSVAGENSTGFSVVDDYFRSNPERDITVAADVRGREAGQAAVQLVPYTWDGFAMSPSTDAPITGTKVAYAAAGVAVRPQITGRFTEATTHYLVRVLFYGEPGGDSDAGQGAYVDRVIAGFGAWDGAYFDGNTAEAGWEGGADVSPSRFFGSARVIKCEVRNAIDFSSVGGGTTAKFGVRLQAPEVFFRDQGVRVATLATGRSGMVHSLYDLSGATARINDAVVRVHGPITNFKLTDVGSGAWVKVDRTVRDGNWIEIDCGEWSVVDQNGASVIEDMRHGGSPVLLPITPVSDDPAPRLRVEGDGIGDGSKIKITAHRRFYVA